ncbi:MAG: ribosome small subunit-dependent GTPase A [Bacteroidales bacterium]
MKTGQAVIVKHTGSHYLLSQLPTWKVFSAVIRGKLRLQTSRATNPVAVGDRVKYEVSLDESGQIKDDAAITEVLSRKNYLIRKATNLSRQSHVIAANIDMAYLLVTLDFPKTKWPFIDRFLVTCEAYNIPIKILMNKIDLYSNDEREGIDYFENIYRGAGYIIEEISTWKNIGIDKIREEIHQDNKLCLFSGVSGVGKSSLIKALDPSLDPVIGKMSLSHMQGKHTTTFYEMHPLSGGGYIIDTPGIRGFGLYDLKSERISTYFPEMLRYMDNCKYMPCTHTHEPGCAVKKALKEGLISAERYNSYLGMLEDEKKYR